MTWPLNTTANAKITGASGLGGVLAVAPLNGFRYSAVQWYRNGLPIAGATDDTYTQTAADIPSPGNSITITVELSGLSLMSTGFTNYG